MSDTPVFLITGCSTGLGRELTIAALERGYRVIATARKPETIADLAAKGAAALGLDVTASEEELAGFAQRAIGVYGRIDVLINNAGYLQGGALEELSLPQMRRQFDTNVFGVIAVTSAFLPHLRERKAGTIVNISSAGAFLNIPGSGIYGASKGALDSLSGSLGNELAPFNIKVVSVTLGGYRTSVAQEGRTTRPAKPLPAYGSLHAMLEWYIGQSGSEQGDPAKAAGRLVDVIMHQGPAAGRTTLPRRFALGDDVDQYLSKHFDSEKKAWEEWRELGTGTNVDGVTGGDFQKKVLVSGTV
ncbi:hypothetical protein PLICRDRAFT_583579 [Plicaturopsis crispa FD-325 SS-3]|nr:hypothetical protein PLICRDRAFT_583579 [Plicaturopsis crispa FD-325 SS-3]